MVTEYSVRWKNLKGEFKHRERTRAERAVEVVLGLRRSYGDDLPITIKERPVGDFYWHLTSWDELVAALPESDRVELRVRQGWIEPVER